MDEMNRNIFRKYHEGKLTREACVDLIGQDAFDCFKEEFVPKAKPKLRSEYTDMYLNVIRTPIMSSLGFKRNLWITYCIVMKENGEIYKFNMAPGSKRLAIGFLKTIVECWYAERDARGKEELHDPFAWVKKDENVTFYGPIYSAPWLRISRKPEWKLSVGSRMTMTTVDGKLEVTGFNHGKEQLITNRSRQHVAYEWKRACGFLNSVDEGPIFVPTELEWREKNERK